VFEDVTAIVVERYDRVRVRGAIRRVHQEDLCQALGYPPTKKYENEGGPGAADIVELLRASALGAKKEGRADSAAELDVATFVDALILNWFVGGTDAHAKNYSLLIGPRQVRLAPLYDVASVFAYPHLNPRKAKLAMKIGGRYRLDEIGVVTWGELADKLHLDSGAVIDRVRGLGSQIPERLATECDRLRSSGLDHPVLARIERDVSARVRRLMKSA
jgi:serine/threonine-protein kinase HipA